MATIFDLSNYDIYRLQSIDPILNDDWQQVIKDVLPQLDADSRKSVFQRLLVPRGILYDSVTKKFFVQKPESLIKVLQHTFCTNDKVMRASEDMLAILALPHDTPILEFAERLEALLEYFQRIELDDTNNELAASRKIRTAFLYDLASWIEQSDITMTRGIRPLTKDMVKTYFKTVFLKHQLQGWDFRSWDVQDIDQLAVGHFPEFLRNEAKDRKFMVVETSKYWFLIGQTHMVAQNAFSFRRFLFEDSDTQGRYIYLTHVVVSRESSHLPQDQEKTLYQVSRLLTLEKDINEEVRLFINSARDLLNRYLHPLIRKSLSNDGSNIDAAIQERMDNYEKQLSILILKKVPRVLHIALKKQDDMDFLFYHLDALIKQMIDSIEDFRLQPLATYATAAKLMAVKLISMRLLLQKTQVIFLDLRADEQQKEHLISEPMRLLESAVEEAEEQIRTIEEIKQEIEQYEAIQQHGTFWEKLRHKKPPAYTLTELKELYQQINEELYIQVVRLAKEKRNLIVYPEFECTTIVDEDFRHYAFPEGEKGITQLPKVIRLPQNREKFNLQELQQTVKQDVLKHSQEW